MDVLHGIAGLKRILKPACRVNVTAMIANVSGGVVDEAGRSSVIIDNVTLSHAGTFVCVAENSVGAIRALSFVRVRGEGLFPLLNPVNPLGSVSITACALNSQSLQC